MGPTHVLIIRRSFLCVSCEISSAASDRAQLELERVQPAAVKKFQLKSLSAPTWQDMSVALSSSSFVYFLF